MWQLDHKEDWVPMNWCFQTVVLEKTWESFWPANRSNQSILKEVNPECSLEGWCWSWSSNTWATWCRELTHWKRLMLGKIEGMRRRGRQRMRCLDGITNSMDMGLGGLRELVMAGRPGVLQSMGSQRVRHDWATVLNWTESLCCTEEIHTTL